MERENRPELSTTIGIVHQSQALGLGISMDDMMRMTPSELQSVVDAALQRDAPPDDNRGKRDKYVAEYYATLNAIKNRHNKNNPKTRE